MHVIPWVAQLGPLPRPHSPAQAEDGQATLAEAIREQDDAALADLVTGALAVPAVRDLFDALLGNSPFLSHCILRDPGFLRPLLTQMPEATLAGILEDIRRAPAEVAALDPAAARAALMTRLRIGKRRAALLIGLADVGGLWPLAQVTGALSDLADGAANASLTLLLRESVAKGDLHLPYPDEPTRGCGFFILGMGKLGARELNYSSDIDLICLFDQDVVDYRGSRGVQDCFIRMTQALVSLLQDRTGDGYVFRTDLRLRPDPGASPVALSVLAAETYYESVGQNWERAAMIKARPVAGDLQAGALFLRQIGPFIWRRHLDFAAIADIHSIKRQIEARGGHRALQVAGHNVKLGRGGIREIEFFVQTQQLIAGGRDARLRDSSTCIALAALASTGRLSPEVAADMTAAYEFLRRVEHRLQMINDAQTQLLPADEDALRHLALFLGYPDLPAFSADYLAQLNRVRDHYAALFEGAPALGDDEGGNLVFTGTEDDPDTIETLSRMGFREPKTVAAAIRSWHHGRYRSTQSVRARELLTALAPRLLRNLSGTTNPDAAFLKFDEFLGKLPAGVQLFSLFYSNPDLLGLVAEIMGGAPRLADSVSRDPLVLDGVLTAGFFDDPPFASDLARMIETDLALAQHYEGMLDRARRWAHERQFQIGVRILRGINGAHLSGPMYSDIAETLLNALLPRAEAEFARRHGRIPGGALGIVALGKLGSREMMPDSDLDLLFLYDAPEDSSSDGSKPLAAPHYYARLSQQVINAISALTAEGRLYEIDMRLRPSGNAGPIAVSIAAFQRYQAEAAWLWEKMALTRARVVAGPDATRNSIAAAIAAVLTTPRESKVVLAEVDAMRQRVAQQFPTQNPWSIKHVRGGLMDIEFMAQGLQLLHADKHPEILARNTAAAFAAMGRSGVLDGVVADELAQHTELLHDLEGMLRLCWGREIKEEDIPAGLAALLVRSGWVKDMSSLQRRLLRTEARIRDLYDTLVVRPAGQPGAPV